MNTEKKQYQFTLPEINYSKFMMEDLEKFDALIDSVQEFMNDLKKTRERLLKNSEEFKNII